MTAVPSLVDVTDADSPFWPRVADRANDVVSRLPQGQPVFLVAHSNAGLFLPTVVQVARRPVAG
ncbi:hypothetical protein ACQP2F_37995 [Actinoplanes sp. CA-030573]|uniref:hypothetical protein n=1 Tax=Actinoplanes sp. CA-030573 TaxID=3239898 RepID=UPI003D8A28D8